MAEAVLAYAESGNLTAPNGDTLMASSNDPLEFESSPVILVADDTGDLMASQNDPLMASSSDPLGYSIPCVLIADV